VTVNKHHTLEEAYAVHAADIDALQLSEDAKEVLTDAITDDLCVGEGLPGSGEAWVRCVVIFSDDNGDITSVFTPDLDLRVPLRLLTVSTKCASICMMRGTSDSGGWGFGMCHRVT
jgi:hypothetical protein